MVKSCRDFLTIHTDAVVEAMMNRKSNGTVEHDLCYRITGVCVDKSANDGIDDTVGNQEM